MSKYSKPALDIQAQLTHLQARGLVISDRPSAERALLRIGYYRLLIYMRPFQNAQKQFNPNCDFKEIVLLYEFDRELRLLCLDAIDRVEVALRAAIIVNLAVSSGSHFHTSVSAFGYFGYFVNFWNQGLRAKSTAIEHYKTKYTDPKEPPIWVLLESLTFGTLSTFFADLSIANRKIIAKSFAFPEKILVSWFRSLTLLRNKCAHHNRVWNATYNANQPIIPKHLTAISSPNTFQAKAVLIYLLLRQMDLSIANSWRTSLQQLFSKYSAIINLQSMGFVPNDPFWQL